MRFSILITTYNQPVFLEEAINSCFNQTYKKEAFEIIVVDDCSSMEYNLNFIEKENIKLTYIKNSKNLGLQKSHNIALYYASGDFVIRLDHDDRLKLDALQKLSDFIDKEINRKIPFIYSDLEIMGENRIRRYPEWKSGSIYDLNNIGHLQCYRRDVALELGGWDCSLKYSADTGFIIKLIEKGYSIKHIPEVLVENRIHSEQYTQQWVREGNDPQYWKNLIFSKSLTLRPDIWIEGRQDVIMQTSGSHLWRSEVKAILDWVDKGLNFIDIGCSNRKKLASAIGIDIDRNGGKCPELVWDANELLPFKEGTLDGIIASHCIEHIQNPIETLEEWGKLLKVGGRIILIVPDVNFTPRMNTKECDPSHKWDWVPETFKQEILDKLDENLFKVLHHAQIGNSWSFLTIIEKI